MEMVNATTSMIEDFVPILSLEKLEYTITIFNFFTSHFILTWALESVLLRCGYGTDIRYEY
jgi:hypothetical protein